MKIINEENIPPKSRKEIAFEYSISYKTLKRRLEKSNLKIPSGLIYPNDQRRIYFALGFPNKTIEKLFN